MFVYIDGLSEQDLKSDKFEVRMLIDGNPWQGKFVPYDDVELEQEGFSSLLVTSWIDPSDQMDKFLYLPQTKETFDRVEFVISQKA